MAAMGTVDTNMGRAREIGNVGSEFRNGPLENEEIVHYTVNPVYTLQKIAQLVVNVYNKFEQTPWVRNEEAIPVHADEEADFCHACAKGAGSLPHSEVDKTYEGIRKAIASLPKEVQSTLHYKVWQKRGSADTSMDSEWGKNHLLTNLHRTLAVVRETIREQLAKA